MTKREPFPVAIDLHELTQAARALQFSLGTGQLLTTRTAREQAQWDARHVLERMVLKCCFEDDGGAMITTLTPWLRHEAAEVMNQATDRIVRGAFPNGYSDAARRSETP